MNTFAVWIMMTSVKYVARLPLKRSTCNLIYQSSKLYTDLF